MLITCYRTNTKTVQMAGVVDKIKKKKAGNRDWSNSGSFINKPAKGWLHPDEQLAVDAGICYGVRYVGSMEVKQSMKSLDFDTRTAVAKESISRVCEIAGLKSAPKKNKRGNKIHKLLGDQPNMLFAGSNVNLTITTESLTIMIMETGETIANHQMPGISFASGGDPDTMDFVAYVAKDEMFGRSCHVLECGGGLAQDVITTIGQAFEIRFKQYLANRPGAVSIPDRMETSLGDGWGEDHHEVERDRDYYNDRPGAQPPDNPEYSSPGCNLPISDGVYNSVKEASSRESQNLIEFEENQVYDNGETTQYDNSEKGATGGNDLVYDNPGNMTKPNVPGMIPVSNGFDFKDDEETVYDNKTERLSAVIETTIPDQKVPEAGDRTSNGTLDPFDMAPFCSSIPEGSQPPSTNNNIQSPYSEPWFHGKITRQQVEEMLKEDGDFLVRESSNQMGQFVLSGRHQGRVKHLLLVDPEGVVRTKDKEFSSITHLIEFHMQDKVPITSSDSELMLKKPILRMKKEYV